MNGKTFIEPCYKLICSKKARYLCKSSTRLSLLTTSLWPKKKSGAYLSWVVEPLPSKPPLSSVLSKIPCRVRLTTCNCQRTLVCTKLQSIWWLAVLARAPINSWLLANLCNSLTEAKRALSAVVRSKMTSLPSSYLNWTVSRGILVPTPRVAFSSQSCQHVPQDHRVKKHKSSKL